MRVLLVDDEVELVSALAERLSLRGIEADWASTCHDALMQIELETYDIAVLDVKMPKVSGLELKREMQTKCPHTKFIFVTGHGSESDFQEALSELSKVTLFDPQHEKALELKQIIDDKLDSEAIEMPQ